MYPSTSDKKLTLELQLVYNEREISEAWGLKLKDSKGTLCPGKEAKSERRVGVIFIICNVNWQYTWLVGRIWEIIYSTYYHIRVKGQIFGFKFS